MAFRWPSVKDDISLAIEVARERPVKPSEWDKIAESLSKLFSNDEKKVSLKGRGCRERMDRILAKYKEEDTKSLKRSGSEEEYSELEQLCEDIITYRRDYAEMKEKEKEAKKKKEETDRKKGEEMRQAAMERLAKRKHGSSSEEDEDSMDEDSASTASRSSKKDSNGKASKKRGTKLSAIQMLEKKYERKSDLKERELKLKAEELELQRRKFDAEADERKEKLKLEMEERRMFLNLLKDRL